MTKPTTFLNWTDGSSGKVTQPPSSQMLSGWTAGEPIPFQYLNWLFYQTDQWLKWLEETIDSEVSIFETLTQSRMINGGNWSFNISTGALAWDADFNLSVPSIADADNQASSGSVTLTDGQVAYVMANIPFTVSGTTVNSSNIVHNLTNPENITVGMTVTGTGIPSSTTVTAITDNGDGTIDATVSNNATAAGTVSLTFFNTTALTVTASDNDTFVPGPTTVVIARRVGNLCFVGMNTSQIVLQNLESKQLNQNGYINVYPITAGETLAYGDVVYISAGNPTDPSRTTGDAYKVDAGVTNGAYRNGFTGIVVVGASSSGTAYVVESGNILLTGLTAGAVYYADPATPGAMTTTKPVTANQWIVPLGTALTSTLFAINSALAAVAQIVAPAVGIGLVSTGTLAIANAASPYTLTSSNNGQLLEVDTSGGTVTLDLPDPTANTSFKVSVKDVTGSFGTAVCMLHRYGSENIEGLAADYVFSVPWGIWHIFSDGTNWYISGVLNRSFRTVTSTDTATIRDDVIRVNTGSGAITETLPAVATSQGKQLTIKNVGTAGNNVTVKGNASENIDGANTQTIADLDSMTLFCNGTSWDII